MARAQQLNRNISKKIKRVNAPTSRAVVNNDVLESLKRRAEDVGLLIHSQPKQTSTKKGSKK